MGECMINGFEGVNMEKNNGEGEVMVNGLVDELLEGDGWF